jgi:hypothetical protein
MLAENHQFLQKSLAQLGETLANSLRSSGQLPNTTIPLQSTALGVQQTQAVQGTVGQPFNPVDPYTGLAQQQMAMLPQAGLTAPNLGILPQAQQSPLSGAGFGSPPAFIPGFNSQAAMGPLQGYQQHYQSPGVHMPQIPIAGTHGMQQGGLAPHTQQQLLAAGMAHYLQQQQSQGYQQAQQWYAPPPFGSSLTFLLVMVSLLACAPTGHALPSAVPYSVPMTASLNMISRSPAPLIFQKGAQFALMKFAATTKHQEGVWTASAQLFPQVPQQHLASGLEQSGTGVPQQGQQERVFRSKDLPLFPHLGFFWPSPPSWMTQEKFSGPQQLWQLALTLWSLIIKAFYVCLHGLEFLAYRLSKTLSHVWMPTAIPLMAVPLNLAFPRRASMTRRLLCMIIFMSCMLNPVGTVPSSKRGKGQKSSLDNSRKQALKSRSRSSCKQNSKSIPGYKTSTLKRIMKVKYALNSKDTLCRIGTWNVAGANPSKTAMIFHALEKRAVDICVLTETHWSFATGDWFLRDDLWRVEKKISTTNHTQKSPWTSSKEVVFAS